ncbi:MAG: polysaccharide deacetylase family protein [Clostridia bacterium]|nr:polysaccharide deacetylase family protein [Clostridia bacterium]
MKIRTIAALLAVQLLTAPAAEGIGFFDLFGQGRSETETETEEEDFTPKRGRFAPERKSGHREKPAGSPSGRAECLPCAAAPSGTGYSWYAAHQKDGKRPPAPAEIPPVGEHGGYYLGADEPVVYLTFDAGYENGNVAKILDGLKAEGVPGAFFILENLVNRNPELVRRMVDEGHLVCNHTARHKDMTAFSETEFKEELGRMEEAYRNLTGMELSRYYRPPEGRFTVSNLDWARELGYSTILWSFAYADWDNDKQMPPDKALEKVLAGAHNGMVLLLHPTSATNAEILPALIRGLKDRGFRFGTLDELTGGGGVGA